MPITPKDPNVVSQEALQQKAQRYVEALINSLYRVGEEAVKIARHTHRYQDQTGNLTSSIGYGVSNDGVIVHESSFEVVKGGSQGAKEGREYLHSLLAQNAKGVTLIVVAGKNYAKYVEAKGLNVLAAASIRVEQMVKQLLDTLKL